MPITRSLWVLHAKVTLWVTHSNGRQLTNTSNLNSAVFWFKKLTAKMPVKSLWKEGQFQSTLKVTVTCWLWHWPCDTEQPGRKEVRTVKSILLLHQISEWDSSKPWQFKHPGWIHQLAGTPSQHEILDGMEEWETWSCLYERQRLEPNRRQRWHHS